MNTLYIYHHLGLGDHIICHGIVRSICEKFDTKQHTLFLKPQFLTSVSFMYTDLTNLILLPFKTDTEIHNFLKNINNTEKLYIGHHHLAQFLKNGLTFDEAFYKQVGLSFDKRWTNFKIVRDYNREKKLLSQTTIPDKYIFLHDDLERKLIIDKKNILNKDLPILTPNLFKTDNIFDFLTLIENAEEIHCMDSAFKLMIDSVCSDRENLFYHIHLSNNILKDPSTFSKNKLNWIVI